MTEREERIPNYIDYPYDVFIKLRLEFLLICQDEIEAKVMRIIEKAIEDKRKNLYRILVNKTPKGEEVQLPEQIWVAISHTFFLDRLYGTVQSLNTLKAALKSLIDKKLILKSEGGNGPYDALEYTLNKPLIKEKLADLPLLDELNVMTMMKQPRKPRKSRKVVETEGQKLTPSNFDTLENEEEGQSLTPQSINNCPPRGSKIDTKEGQKLTPKPRDIDYYLDDTQREENAHVSDDNAPTPSLSSNSPSSLQESTEEKAPAPSDEQSSKQAVSDSQSKDVPPAQDTGKTSSGKPGKASSQPAKPAQSKLIEDEPKPPARPQMPAESMKWGTNKCKLMFDAWRGAPLMAQYKLNQSSGVAKNLSTYYSEDEVKAAKMRMDEDEYYIDRGGADIFDVGNNIAKYLKIIEKEAKFGKKKQQNKGNLNDQRTRTGIKTGVEVGSSMPPQKPEPTQAELDEIEAMMVKMGIKKPA